MSLGRCVASAARRHVTRPLRSVSREAPCRPLLVLVVEADRASLFDGVGLVDLETAMDYRVFGLVGPVFLLRRRGGERLFRHVVRGRFDGYVFGFAQPLGG